MLYPNKIKKDFQKVVNHSNRGMDLESLINEANKYYLLNDLAVIYKKPTPVTISKIKTKDNNAKEVSGYLKQKSTLDYVGLYKGRYLDFDAKSTINKTCLPIANIHPHQLEHIKRIINHQGISFLIIEIKDKYYLLKGEDLLEYIKQGKQKNIAYDYIKEKGIEIKLEINPYLNYLKAIDQLIEGENK